MKKNELNAAALNQIDPESIINLNFCGVYIIKNIINNKIYVGSTNQSFKIRFKQHFSELIRKCHKNNYLQYSCNKYGIENFLFSVIEVCDKKVSLEREQVWLNNLNSSDKKIGYNINPNATGTPNLIPEVIKRRSEKIKKTHQDANVWYYKVKNENLPIEEVPSKYHKMINYHLNNKIWNKGLTKLDYDCSNLKKPKTITPAFLEGRKQFSQTQINKKGGVSVYDYLGNHFKDFDSIDLLIEYSKCYTDLPLILRNKKGRNNYSPNHLNKINIFAACRGKVAHYKGLILRYRINSLPIIPLTLNDLNTRVYSKR